MRKYEAMFILNNNLDEETRKSNIDSLVAVLTNGGANVTKVDEWGSRDLAYEINFEKKGYYVVVNFETDSKELNAEFVRVCNINSNVIRHIVVALPQ